MWVLLACRVRPRVPKLLTVFKIEAFYRLTERAVRLNPIRRDSGTEVIGNKCRVAGRIYRNVSRSGSSRGYLANLMKVAACRVQRKGRDGCRGIINRIDRIKRAVA